ncbi:hypothetical protein CS0771_66500 [Catellatospora sp. IY07-71]|uniref:SMI1/KNR4 family protein n=1 Tax=Catellatospora sp. IY07-71 TaxID=2728827 RepID=UPI001BB3FAC8|nr:SMI1/KNR4 family protein [Catellatospora sp. IY07-71]BCJ77106.1 hypothetical protein CS0771_66500 [Catellatospora sp. IY07-71]
MSLERLLRLAPAPPARIDVPNPDDFAACEAELRLTLPADFKELLSAYGAGRFLDYLFAYPLTGYDMNMLRNKALLAGHQEARERFPDWYPWPLYPEPGGLLLWGGTYDGHSLCWLTAGDPDTWPVIVWQQRDGGHERFDGGAVELLTRWLAHELPNKVLPEPPRLDAWFEPMRPLREVYVYLDGGEGGFGERARSLRRLLGPTTDRGENHGQGDHEVHFATAGGWRVTYRQWQSGRLIRVAFPAHEEQAARAAVLRVIPLLGHTLRHAQTQRGRRVWAD